MGRARAGRLPQSLRQRYLGVCLCVREAGVNRSGQGGGVRSAHFGALSERARAGTGHEGNTGGARGAWQRAGKVHGDRRHLLHRLSMMHALRTRNTALNRVVKKVLTIFAAAGLGCARFVLRKHTFTGV